MNNDWLDIDVLEDYLNGKLDARGMHFVERQALEDPFVAEALEGLRQSPKRKQSLSILQKQLHDRVSEKPVKRKMWGITTQRLSIAATATVAFISVSILFFMRETNRKNAEIAARKANGVIVNLDTTNAVVVTKPDKLTGKNNAPETALINKAITEAKTGYLAKNKRQINKASEAAIAAQEPLNEENLNKAQSRSFSPRAEQNTALKEADMAQVTAAGNAQVIFSGNVVDKVNGKPIQGAIVKSLGAKGITATDSKGFFALPVDSASKDKDLLISAIGFKEVPVVGVQDPNAIRNAMSGDKSLQEIALITGSNGRKKEDIKAPTITLRAVQNLDRKLLEEITKPIPVSTVNYQDYLEHNNKLYNPKGPEQYVILSFKVNKSGRPSNIRVIKSLDKKADAEARRLIQAGPDWVLPKKGTNEVELSIKF
ncbi:energy transducer TonB [Pedobacter frigidisoli]|uniref:energy transducer TonB n=1 Tax=Pedobacter frigidisoli TaxID=2530455 RepID=UPI00292D0EB0|nr:energy transducer TonB [Pedobacter frigidisoli]